MHSVNPRSVSRSIKARLSLLFALSLAASFPASSHAAGGGGIDSGRMRMSAGTAFNLSAVFDENGPVFPWFHEVRGVVRTSNLGNATVAFQITINSGADCDGGHQYCLSGTMTLTTLAGDQLQADVTGWGDPDPEDPNQPAAMNLLHYDVVIKGGTGQLEGATGLGEINGVFNFCGPDCFCDSYAGVANWEYDGLLHLPKGSGK